MIRLTDGFYSSLAGMFSAELGRADVTGSTSRDFVASWARS
jgi:hypothetical protein